MYIAEPDHRMAAGTCGTASGSPGGGLDGLGFATEGRRVIARRALVKWSGSKLPFSTSAADFVHIRSNDTKGRRPCQPGIITAPSGRSATLLRRQGRARFVRKNRRVGGPLGEAANEVPVPVLAEWHQHCRSRTPMPE